MVWPFLNWELHFLCQPLKILNRFFLIQFDEIEHDAVGTYSFTRSGKGVDPMVMCQTRYREGKIDASNQTYMFDTEIINGKKNCCHSKVSWNDMIRFVCLWDDESCFLL